MIATLRVLLAMGSLRRLFPFWALGLGIVVFNFNAWIMLALVYGVVLQFFVEYAIHRFLYHRTPPRDQNRFNALYRSHIGHHEFPNDPEFFTGDDHWFPVRFGLASVASHTLVLAPVFGLWAALAWSVAAIFAGSVSAYAFYEYCHTLAHLNVPKGWFGRRITRSHLAHHHQDHDATFHVSFGMGWIDRLFGTAYDHASARARYDRKTMLSIGMNAEDLRLVTARKAAGVTNAPGAHRAKATAEGDV